MVGHEGWWEQGTGHRSKWGLGLGQEVGWAWGSGRDGLRTCEGDGDMEREGLALKVSDGFSDQVLLRVLENESDMLSWDQDFWPFW